MNRFWLMSVFVVGTLRSVLAQGPVISYTNEGTRGDETLVIAGCGFVPGKTRVWVHTPDMDVLGKLKPWRPELDKGSLDVLRTRAGHGLDVPPLPATPPKGSHQAKMLAVSDWGVACVLGRVPLVNTHIVYVEVDGRFSPPYVVNRPQLWWTLPREPVRGRWLDVFGCNLRRMSAGGFPTRVTLRHLAHGKPVDLVLYESSKLVNAYTQRERQTAYWAKVHVPADFPTGRAELRAHNFTGGKWGWSDPLVVAVKPAPKPVARIVNAREQGVVGNGLADDGPALQKAVDALAKAGGGVLFLPPGTYATGRTLYLGGGVTVRGAARENTVVCGHKGRAMPEPAAIFQGGSDWALENLTILGAVGDGSTAIKGVICVPSKEFKWPQPTGDVSARWAIRRCRIESYILPRDKPLSWDRGNSALFALRVRDYEITDSVIIGNHGAAWIWSGEHGRIERNTFRTTGTAGGGPIGGGRWCLIQDNLVDICTRGISPGWRECYAAWNIHRDIGGGENAGETMLAENAFGPHWLGRPASVDADGLTIPADAFAKVDKKPDTWAGWVVTVINGKGLGQVRDVVRNDGARMIVDRPWRVVPDKDSLVSVAKSGRRLVLMGNVIRNGDAAIQLWGSCVECYVERTVDERTMGCMALGGYRGPVFWSEYRNHRARERGTLGFAALGHVDGVWMLGNSIRQCSVVRPLPQMHSNSYYWGPRHNWMAAAAAWLRGDKKATTPIGQFNVIEHCRFWDCRRGVHLGPNTAHNVVRRNAYTEVDQTVLDEGTGNVVQDK